MSSFYPFFSPISSNSEKSIVSPLFPSHSGEDDPYSPWEEEEESFSFFGGTNSKSRSLSQEGEVESKRDENLDQRLNRLMLGEDLPLFLQEFAEEWQEGRKKKGDKLGPIVVEEANVEEVEILFEKKIGNSIKKNLKRLGKNERSSCCSDISKIASKMVAKMMEQVKEDIIDKLVADQVDSWFQSHTEYPSEAVQVETENNIDEGATDHTLKNVPSNLHNLQ